MHYHKLNLKDLPQTKSRDRIFVRLARHRTRQRTEAEGRPVHCYDVLNMTQRTASEVELFKSADGECFGGCDCVARVICKHITKTVALHVARMTAQKRASAPAARPSRPTRPNFWEQFARS